MIMPAMGIITLSDRVFIMSKIPEFQVLGGFADLPCNRAYLVIDIGKHGFKVCKHPSLQQFLYEFSNLINDPAHEL